MPAHIQWLDNKPTGIFRVGGKMQEYGDPYELSCTVQLLPDGGLELCGAVSSLGPLLLKHFAEMRTLFLTYDIEYVTWERIRDGQIKRVKIPVRRK